MLVGASNVEDIYELAPLQRGMLLHSAHDGAADMYLSQQTYMADGDLDPGALVEAWRAVVAAHPALRTSFHWEGLDKPLQVVHRDVTLPVFHHDWSGIDEDQQRQRLDELRAEDAASGFDLSVAPLQRLNVIRFSADRFGLVWAYHHLLMDGWSIPTFMRDVLGHYRALTAGGPPPPPARRFRDYVAWLEHQDPDASKSFWADLFAGVTPSRLIPLKPGDPQRGTGAVDRRDVRLPTSWTQELRAAAAKHRVTLGTMMYAAWATVLYRYSDRRDVIFGCVSSGRPAELLHVDRIIGVFANTLPVRVTIPDGGDLGEWLREIQHTYAQMRRYEYTPLADIKKWAGAAGRQLFDSTLSIENYSIAIDTTQLADELTFRQDALYDKISYPVAVAITPEFGAIQFLVHRERFEPDFIDDALACLRATLEALTTATRVDDLTAAVGPPVAPATPPTAAERTEPAEHSIDHRPTPPATPLEHAVAEVYREILEATDIDVTASFFDLGGDSFDAVRAISRIDGATVGMLAANPSIRELAQALTPATTATADLDDEISQLEELLAQKRADKVRHDGNPAIVPVPRDGAMVCTYQQEGMWFMNQFAPSWTSYHVPIALRLHGNLDVPALERAMHALVVRHEALRTRFVNEGGLPRQVIEPPPVSMPLPMVDLAADQVVPWATHVYAQPFDLAGGSGFRVAAARLAPDEHAVVMVFHHIVTDGWSARVLAGELSALYAAEHAGSTAELPPLDIQPADYAAWQRRWLDGAERDRQIGHWRDALTGLSTVDFPADRSRPAQPTGAGANISRMFPPEVATAAHAYTKTHQVSLLAVLHAGLLAVLHRYTGQHDLPVGSLLTGRTRIDIEPMVGYFGSIVVLRTDLSGAPTFADLVHRCHDTILDATTYQDVPFTLVVDALRPERVAGRNPLFQIALTLHPPGISAALRLGDVTGEPFEVEEEYTLWDLAVDVTDAPDGNLYAAIEYSSELFDADRMERLFDHFAVALAGGLSAPDTRLGDIDIMAAAERHQVLHAFGPGAEPPETAQLVHRMVETVAAHTPDAVAVVDHDGGTLTYRQLDEAANRLAHRLRRDGVGPGVPVGVCLRPGGDLVTALLATWKAGGCQVSLDPGTPADGLASALASTPSIVVTHGEHAARFDSAIMLDGERAAVAAEPATAPDGGSTADDLASVLRTAGTTGTSKAVLVPHRAVHDQVTWLQDTCPLQPTDRVLHDTPCGFHGSVSELFWPLTTGAAVVLAAPGGHRDPEYLHGLIARQHVTTMHVVPTTLRAFLDEAETVHDAGAPTNLRLVLSSGEALPAHTVRRFLAAWPDVELYNVWGSTETSDVTVWRGEPDTTAVGRPSANVRTYVLDDRLRPVPIGVAGQLFVAGSGVAHGYLDRPALTAERFVADPHTELPGERIYATGDLVRWRADGLLEYVGRSDRRVTLRGQRIDLGQIEDALAAHPHVRNCAVVPRDDADLTAYVVGRPGHGELDLTELRRYLTDQLPSFMHPVRLITLPELPLTPDGKLNIARVPDPPPPVIAHVPPRTDTERWLAATWQDLVGEARVGADDNFFELGGNSLHATRLVAHIRDGLGVDLHVRQLFTNPTLEQLAARIEEIRTGSVPDDPADAEELDENRELSDRAIR